tara:strand:- start:2034 stop:2981 length:948 start_codon:yes stop_codon:yes gene_type:complete
MPYIRDLDCGELCSPFLGGGSIELACAKEEIIVHGYDLFQPLVWFWEALLSNPQKLYKHVGAYRQQVRAYTDKTISTAQWHKKCSGKCLITLDHTEFCNHHKKLILIANNKMLGVSKKNFEMCRELANSRTAVTSQSKLFEAAAQYYIVNRTSFSGATTSGGWSWKASWARLTQSTLDRLKEFTVPNFTVARADFKDSIAAHPEAALYLDPPYCLNESDQPVLDEKGKPIDQETLYGTDGNLHGGFDHVGLSSILKQRSNWVLSYNNCKYITKLYAGYKIVPAEWAYGMKNVKDRKDDETSINKMGKSSEILIIG